MKCDSLDFLCSVVISDRFLGCEYCPLEFQSRHDRIQHTATHFQSKSCGTCHKVLLCINGDWYELHASPHCEPKIGQQNDPSRVPVANDIKDEVDFVTDARQAFKSEANEYESSDEIDRDTSEFVSISMLEPHIEMKPIPQIVKSLAKLKTNVTISARAKARPDRVRRRESEVKVRRRNPSSAIAKRVSNKSSFLDHRPQGKKLVLDKNRFRLPFNSKIIFMYVFEHRFLHLRCMQ